VRDPIGEVLRRAVDVKAQARIEIDDATQRLDGYLPPLLDCCMKYPQ
jgi:hypothetical protein